MHFSEIFENNDLEFFANIKAKAMALLTHCETDEDLERQAKQIKACDDYFYRFEKPRNFRADDPTNALVEFENSFQEMLSALEMNGFNTQNVSILQLYSRIKYLRRVNSKNKQDGNKTIGRRPSDNDKTAFRG